MATMNQVGVVLSGSTGTGNFVGANTPTLITPVIGAATGTSLTTTSFIQSTLSGLRSGSSAAGFGGELDLYTSTPGMGFFTLKAADNAGNYANVLTNASTSALRTWTLPDASGTIALTSGASGIVNSGTQNQLTWYAANGTTVSGLATANNGVLITSAGGVPSISSTLPSGIAATNMALTTPLIGTITDTSGNNMLAFLPAPSAVNYFRMINGGAGSGITLQAFGASTDITLGINSKGAGQVSFTVGANSNQLVFTTNTGGNHESIFNFPSSAASRTYTFPDATGTIALTSGGGALSVPSITFTTTTGTVGTTTNDSAAAGSVGELIETIVLIGSPVSMTSGVSINIASISLTAGDWDVWAEFWTAPDVTTTSTIVKAGITPTTGTMPTVPATNTALNNLSGSAFAAGTATSIPVAACRQSLSGTTTIYLVGNVTFAVSTMGGYGKISARRRR